MRAVSRDNSNQSDASAQFEYAVCNGLFHEGVLLRLLEYHFFKSAELLHSACGA